MTIGTFFGRMLRPGSSGDSRELYLDLIKRCLTNLIYRDDGSMEGRPLRFNERARREGRDWPACAHTMVGTQRLDNLQRCIEDVIRRGISGDLLDAGVWRGGTAIFMKAVLKAHGVSDRAVWVVDSFAGLPAPDAAKYPLDATSKLHEFRELAVPLPEVMSNFQAYGLLDERVRFLKGWFRDTLPSCEADRLAVLRIDGDMYESTWDVLLHMYPKVQRGGYVIVDDYNDIPACRQAVIDYRSRAGIKEEMRPIDWTAIYWQKH